MGEIKILNWNIGGAKFLEKTDRRYRPLMNKDLQAMVRLIKPDVVTLQEVVWYGKAPYQPAEKAECVLDQVRGYRPLFTKLINTDDHNAQGKWRKLYKAGWDEGTYFAQGNTILIREQVHCYPVFSLPSLEDAKRGIGASENGCMEVVQLECGLYFGDRDTEPRAAQVVHLVYTALGGNALTKPLDVFIVNLHFTTIMREREGVPGKDEEASRMRMRQLGIVLYDVVTRYNNWRKSHYEIREVGRTCDPDTRHAPIWVLAGDFNFTPESLEYETLIRRGFIDLMSKEARGDKQSRYRYTKARGRGLPPTLTVDYVFGGPKFEAIDAAYADENISDATSSVLSWREHKQSDHYPMKVSVPIDLK
jgi:endonuclease/exonuclease/phosphatase family metal-dependent hydrolase